nr:copia protein [Tanacetum cinerariifolium]
MHDEFEMSMMGELNFFLGLQIKQMEDIIFFNQSVRINSLLDVVGITATQVYVNTAQLELVQLMDFNKKYTKCLLLLVEVKTTDMDQDFAHMVAASKVPMLKPEWCNLTKTQVVEGVTTVIPITTIEEKAQRRLEVKAITTLMIGISNEHQLKFNSIKDAKQLLEAVEKRFVNTANKVTTASTQVNAALSTNIDNLSDAIIYSFFASQPSSPLLVHEDLEQIHPEDMEKMNLRWQMAMLTMRTK